MGSLLKAYLRGDTDPIMLAKAYYEDMVYKSVSEVEDLIKETLTFDMDKDMKLWMQEVKEAQDEIKFWKGLVSNLEEANIFGFKTMLQEAQREDAGDIETINIEEVPAYIKELENHIKNVQANINDANEEYEAVVKKIVGMDVEDWERGQTYWDEDTGEKVENWPPEVYIEIHELGLNSIRSRLKDFEDRFQSLKDAGEISGIRPEKLARVERAINSKIQEFEQMSVKDRPSLRQRNETLAAIQSEISNNSSEEWRWKYYENEIKNLKLKEKKSVESLNKFKIMTQYTKDIEEIKSKMNKKGYELVSPPQIEIKNGVPEFINPNYYFTKLIDPKNDKIPEHQWEKKHYEYDAKTDEIKELKPEEVESKVTTQAEHRMRFSDEKWWKQLSRTADRVTDSPDVKSKKIFQNALRKFFEGFKGTRFDEPAISGNTNSGIGGREDGKEIKENPNVRLNNLTRLYALFEEHVSQPVNRSKNIDIIMAGLKAEIEHLETVFDRKRDKEGQVPNKDMGKKILKTLIQSLTGIYESAKNYKGGDYPEKLIKNVNKVKRTRLTISELKTFSLNKVTVKSLLQSNDREVKDRAKFLLDTFDEDWSPFKKVVKLLNRPIGREDNKLIDVIADVWDKEGVYKPPTKRGREEQSQLNMLLDEALGEFEKTLDEQENAVTQIADPELEEKIEQNLEWMAVMLEYLEDGIDFEDREYSEDEDEDELLQWFANTVTEFRNRVWEVMRRLNPDDPDFKRIKEIKDKIIDEVKNIPRVSNLVEDLVKIRSTNSEYILNERLAKVESMANAIAMAKLGGRDDLKFLLKEDGSLNEDLTKKWIETQLEDAKSNKGRSKRNRLINKIINNSEILEKDVNYDLKQTLSRNRQMAKEIDGEYEEYDETDVGQRQTEEMMEGTEEIYDELPDEPEPEEESEEQRRLDEDEDW